MEKEKKIGLPEAIVATLIVASADIFEVFTDVVALVPIIGQILLFFNFFIDFGVLAFTQIWLILKGGIAFKKQASSLVGNLLEFIPGLDALPLRTATLLLTIYLINKEGEQKEAIEETNKETEEEKISGGAETKETGEVEYQETA